MCDTHYYPWCPENDADWHLIAAAPDMLQKLEKITVWLDRLAGAALERAKDRRFLSLAEANEHDAKNYKKTADDIRKVISAAKGAE